MAGTDEVIAQRLGQVLAERGRQSICGGRLHIPQEVTEFQFAFIQADWQGVQVFGLYMLPKDFDLVIVPFVIGTGVLAKRLMDVSDDALIDVLKALLVCARSTSASPVSRVQRQLLHVIRAYCGYR
jgi:hypothetical protein